MAKPTKLPTWATDDLIDAINALPNKTEPTPEFKASGLNRAENLTRQHINYQFNLLNEWITFLQDTGTIVKTVVTASDPTWVPNANTKSIKFTCIGGGGGAGGISAGTGTGAASSQGGAGGGTVIVQTNTVDATYAIVVGTGGAGDIGGGSIANAGLDTTVTSTTLTLVANGGEGGSGDTVNGTQATTITALGGGASGGDINARGSDSPPCAKDSSRIVAFSLSGASSLGGSLAVELSTVNGVGQDGTTATTYGAGGGGCAQQGTGLLILTGGTGAAGIVIIEEYL